MSPDDNPSPDAQDYRDLNRALLLLLALSLGWVLAVHGVSYLLGRPLDLCASRVLLGIPCPLCGLTRGLTALLKGHVARAMAWNPLTLPAAVGILAEAMYRAWGSTTTGARRLRLRRRFDYRLHVGLGAGFLLYAVYFYLRLPHR